MSIENSTPLLIESPVGFFRLTDTLDEQGNYAIVSFNRIVPPADRSAAARAPGKNGKSIPLGIALIYTWVGPNPNPRTDLPALEVCLINHAMMTHRDLFADISTTIDCCITCTGARFSSKTRTPNKRYPFSIDASL